MLRGDTTIYDTLSLDLGTIITRCIDTTDLTGAVDTIYNDCSENFSQAVSFVINPNTGCLKIQPIECGTDTACIVICDINGVCETHTFIVTSESPTCQPQKSTFTDMIYVGASGDFCVDTSEMPGIIIGYENGCKGMSGTSVIFDTYTDNGEYCVTYTAIEEGVDTACLIIMDDRGFLDTTCVIITAKYPTTTIQCDTLVLGTDTVFCPINDELPGIIVDIQNICPASADSSVIFTVNPLNLCVDISTVALGTDSACIIICNEDDICDTTIYKIVVVEPDSIPCEDPPIAVNDTASTETNSPLVLNVVSNDTIPCRMDSVKITIPPARGTVIRNIDYTIEYTPLLDSCGIDSFQYCVCNEFACDTAWVILDVRCPDEFLIHTGISPNGDDINDNWIIKGIENFPNNIVYVQNRWGNRVFEMPGYRSTWDGTWNEMPLPDGTYFYVLDLFGDGRDIRRGYLQIHRQKK